MQPDNAPVARYIAPSDEEMTSYLEDLKQGKPGITAVLLQAVANVARVKFSIHTAEGSTVKLLPYEPGDVVAEISLGLAGQQFVHMVEKQGN